MWQQRLLHQSYKTWTLIGGQWASGAPDRRLQLAPEHTAGGLLHQSTCFIEKFSRLIPTVNCVVTLDSSAKRGTVKFVKIRPAVPHTIRPEMDFTS